MGSSMPTLGGITNLIRSETGVREGVVASQICTNHGGKALRAIDGNTDGYWHNGSVMHTCDRSAAWWKVDLGRDNAIITSVSVTNRRDCCQDRLSNTNLEILDASGTVVESRAFDGIHDVYDFAFDQVGAAPSGFKGTPGV